MADGVIRKIFGEIGFKDKASKDVEKLNENMEETKESMIGMAQVAGAVVTAAFIALANASFEAGKELELQTVRLEVLSGDAYPALTDSMNEAIAASEGLTATGDMSLALNQALKMGASIDVLTGSMAELQKLSFIAGDDLARSMKDMSRSIATGSTRFLEQNVVLSKNIDGFKKLGMGYDEATKKKRELFIVDALQRNQIKIQEQYNKIVETTAGQLQIASTQWGNILETIGGLMLRGLKPLIKVGAQLLRFLGETERGMAIVETAFIALSVVVGVVAVASFKALAVAAWAALVPMAPFLLIALAIIAAVTTLVLVIEDLWTGIQGGESVLFKFFGMLLKIHFFISNKITEAINFMIDSLKALGVEIFNFFQGLLPDWAIKLLTRLGSSGTPQSPGVVPARAAGGPVQAGKPFVVGEDGPELFVPGNSGNIIPNNMMGGSSVKIDRIIGTLNIIVQNASEAADEVQTAVLNALNSLSENTFAAELGIEIT
jgi:hypothetical protein